MSVRLVKVAQRGEEKRPRLMSIGTVDEVEEKVKRKIAKRDQVENRKATKSENE